MYKLFISLFLLLSCSEPKIAEPENIKQVYYRYLLLTKLNLDSLQVKSNIDSLLIKYNVKNADFNSFKTKVDSNIEFRLKVFDEFSTELDSNKSLDTLFQFFKNIH